MERMECEGGEEVQSRVSETVIGMGGRPHQAPLPAEAALDRRAGERPCLGQPKPRSAVAQDHPEEMEVLAHARQGALRVQEHEPHVEVEVQILEGLYGPEVLLDREP